MNDRGESVANDTGIREDNEIRCEAFVKLNSVKVNFTFYFKEKKGVKEKYLTLTDHI